MPLFLQELSNLPWVKLTTNHMTFHVCFCPWDHNTHGSMVSLPSWMKCLERDILVETCRDAHNSLLSGACHHLLLKLFYLVCSMCGPTLLPRKQLSVIWNTLKKSFLHVKSIGKNPWNVDAYFLHSQSGWWQANLNKLPCFFRVHS